MLDYVCGIMSDNMLEADIIYVCIYARYIHAFEISLLSKISFLYAFNVLKKSKN